MSIANVFIAALVSTAMVAPQAATAAENTPLPTQAALPIVFTKTVSSNHAHVGDAVLAKTTQTAKLPNGTTVPSGTVVVGHVAAANGFTYDKTPYAQQKQAALTIRFDAIRVNGQDVPLALAVRAMADPIVSFSAWEAKSTDLDPAGTRTQIGGDLLTPSQSEVVNRDGDVVAYNRRDGVYARLIAHGNCNASSTEVSVGIYSASACGLYGFGNVSAHGVGTAEVSLISTHGSPQIAQHSTALLEVVSAGSR